MNKIYKVIWSKAKHTYVVASEIAKGHTKGETTGKGLKRLAAALLVAAALMGPNFAWAEDTATVATDAYTKAETDQKVNAANTYTYRKVAAEEKAREAADTEIKQDMTDQKTSTALHVSKDGNLIVGTKENQTVKDMKIRGKLTSGSISTGDITSSGDVTVTGKMAADGVTDETTNDGTYIKQNNTVGNNLVSLDTQVKANADAINEEARKRKYSVTNLEKADAAEAATREAADNELNERITNEANAIHETTNQLQKDLNTETAAREAGDKALDTRITNVKEYLENQTSENYVSKTDAAVQDGAIVKADKTIGENVTNLDAALTKETAARIGADKAQDEVIQQVNQNMVDGFNTINKNMADGFTALNNADLKEAQERAAADTVLDDKITAETSARVAADTKLVEAVNSGLSLSNDNVLQKNTTTIDAQGNVTTSKTDANEMILNKGKDNQITLNEKGIKVGTNSSVMDKDGVYTGGDTYSEAKAALKSDGSIKGADGKFTVNSANGTVNVNDQIELNGATGVVKSNGLNVGDGNFTVNSNGGVKAADGKITLNSDGSVKVADGNFTVNSNGGVKAADGKITLNSDGSLKAADGKFTVDSNGAVKAANGNTTIDSNGNLKTAGTLSAADGSFKVDSNGKITSIGLDAGNGTIQTTGTVQAGDVKTGTLETTGDATIGGNLTVDKNLTVNGEFNAKTLSSKLDENNYTTITGGKTQSMNLKLDAATGETKSSASTFDENGSNAWAKDDDSIGKSSMTADSIRQRLSDIGDNPTVYAERTMSQGTDKKYSMVDTVKDGDKTNVASQTASESSSVVSGKDGENNYKSYITQNMKKILQKIEDGDGNVLTSTEQTETGITNTAANGTITNDAKALVNKASDSITSQIGDGSAVKSVMDANGIANTATGGTISNSAANISNTTTGNMTNTVGGNLIDTIMGTSTTTVTGKVTEDYKSDLSTKVGGDETHAVTGNQTTTVSGNRTVNVKGTETENFNALETNVKTDQKTSVGGNQTTIVTGNQTNNVSGSKNETVKGSVTEKYGSQATTVDGDQSTNIGGNQTTVVAKDQTNTVSGNKTETVKGAVNETYGSQTTKVNGDQSTTVTGKQTNSITGDQVNTIGGNQTTTVTGKVTEDYKSDLDTKVGGNQTTTVTGDSSLSAKNITNKAEGGTIYNKSKDILNEVSGDILNFADGEIGNSATKITNLTGDNTVTSDTNGTTFENKAHSTAVEEGTITKTTISGNTITTGEAVMDYADVMKDLGVRGNAAVDGNTTLGKEGVETTLTVNSKSTFNKDVTVNGTTTTDKLVVNNGATIKGGAAVTGGTTTDKLHVTSTSQFDGAATFKDIVTMEKDLNVGGNAKVAGDVTAKSYKVGDKTYIDGNGINANDQVIRNVGKGDISEGSTDAVSGGQLYETNTRVSGLETRMGTVETRVDKLDNKIDKVGANAAAMANLHPLEFDEDSKWNIAAAVGSSGSETASAVGVFYRPNENVMVNASAAMGTGENMFGGGVSLRLGHGGNKAKEAQMKAAAAENKELRAKVDDLTARMDALLSVLNPNMSKDFPDVPENHWAYEAVSRLAGNGIVEGYEDGKYHGERQMTRYEMAEIIYNALSKGAKAEKKLVEEFRPELQAMAAQKKA